MGGVGSHIATALVEVSNFAGKVISVATGKQFTWPGLIGAIDKVLGKQIESMFANRRPGDVRESLADFSPALHLLKYKQHVRFGGGLARSIEYHRGIVE